MGIGCWIDMHLHRAYADPSLIVSHHWHCKQVLNMVYILHHKSWQYGALLAGM